MKKETKYRIVIGVLAGVSCISICFAAAQVAENREIESQHTGATAEGGKQDTINALSDEIAELKEKLSVARNDIDDALKETAESFLKAYYDIDYDDYDPNEYFEEVKEYLSVDAQNTLELNGHEEDEDSGYERPDISYVSEIDVQHMFYEAVSEEEANVFVAAQHVVVYGGNPKTTSPLLVLLNFKYDSGSSKWMIDGITYYGR